VHHVEAVHERVAPLEARLHEEAATVLARVERHDDGAVTRRVKVGRQRLPAVLVPVRAQQYIRHRHVRRAVSLTHIGKDPLLEWLVEDPVEIRADHAPILDDDARVGLGRPRAVRGLMPESVEGVAELLQLVVLQQAFDEVQLARVCAGRNSRVDDLGSELHRTVAARRRVRRPLNGARLVAPPAVDDLFSGHELLEL
jgi:hypothetical protein